MKKIFAKEQNLDSVIEDAFNELISLPQAELKNLIYHPENEDVAELILASNMLGVGEVENATYACSYVEYEPSQTLKDFSMFTIGKDDFTGYSAFTELTKIVITSTPNLIGLDLPSGFGELESFLKHYAQNNYPKPGLPELLSSEERLYFSCLKDQGNYQWIKEAHISVV